MTERQEILNKWGKPLLTTGRSLLDGIVQECQEDCAVAMENQLRYNESLHSDDDKFPNVAMFKRLSIPLMRRLFNVTPTGGLKSDLNVSKKHTFAVKWSPEIVENDTTYTYKLDAECEYTANLAEALGDEIKALIERDGQFTIGHLFVDEDGSLAGTYN